MEDSRIHLATELTLKIPRRLEQPSLRNITVALTDFNGNTLSPFYMFYKYTLVASLMHNGVKLSSDDHVVGQTAVESSKQRVSFGFELKNIGGRNFAIRFTGRGSQSSLVTTTSVFTVFPLSLQIESTELGGAVDARLAAVTVSCRDSQAQLIKGIRSEDSFYIRATIYRNQTQILSCSS